MSSGSKPVTTIGTSYFSAIGRYSSKPMIVQTCPAARKPCTRSCPSDSSASIAGGTSTCETSSEKFSSPVVIRLPAAIALAGAVVSKPTAKNTTCRSRILLCQGHRVQRRVDDPHVAAFRLDVEQALRRTGHAQHVAERAEDHVRPLGDGHGLVDHLDGRDAHRAAGAVDESDFARQQVIEAALDDGVRLAAADFHDRPRARDLWESSIFRLFRSCRICKLQKQKLLWSSTTAFIVLLFDSRDEGKR